MDYHRTLLCILRRRHHTHVLYKGHEETKNGFGLTLSGEEMPRLMRVFEFGALVANIATLKNKGKSDWLQGLLGVVFPSHHLIVVIRHFLGLSRIWRIFCRYRGVIHIYSTGNWQGEPGNTIMISCFREQSVSVFVCLYRSMTRSTPIINVGRLMEESQKTLG